MWDTFKAIWLNIWRIFNPNFSIKKDWKIEKMKIDKNTLFKEDKFIRFTNNSDRWDLHNISVDFKEIWNDMLKVLKK